MRFLRFIAMPREASLVVLLFILVSVSAMAQDPSAPSRGSLPEDLLRPGRGEAPRYPIDIVIGELGRGKASANAFSYANSIAAAFISARPDHPLLATIDEEVRNIYLAEIDVINPSGIRVGGGRTEPDGAVSFLVRFMGREQSITGELYIRFVSRPNPENEGEEAVTGYWIFDELFLEEPKDREAEFKEAMQRLDYFPYERFY